jgi:voltage-gated potassium channel
MESDVEVMKGAMIAVPKGDAEGRLFRFRYSIASLVILVAIAIVAFHYLEGWSFLDSTYFATTAITTMGSDMHPQTVGGKIFTILYLWGGVALGFYILMRMAPIQSRMIETRMKKAMKFMRRKHQ